MENEILNLLSSNKKAISIDYICNELDYSKKDILDALEKLENNFSVIKNKKGNYIFLEHTSFRKGRYYYDRRNNGKVVVSSSKDNNTYYDVLDKKDAIDGDYVLVNLQSKEKRGPLFAEIKKVLTRDLDRIKGEVYSKNNKLYIRPISKKYKDLNIELLNDAKIGSKVLVSLPNQTTNNYLGSFVKYINEYFEDLDSISIANDYGFDDKFTNATLKQVNAIPLNVRDIDLIGRVDLRNKNIFTIDCSDTKDMDDAISCEILPNGNYSIGVHIADVSYYVPLGSHIDQDAYQRGTSLYLTNKVFPMLPVELSNGICSLNPNVDRLAVSCIMEIDSFGNLKNYNIFKSVINSKKKMNYDEVNNLLNGKNYDISYASYSEVLNNLNNLATKLKQNRMNDYALDFNKNEAKFVTDEFNNVTDIVFRNNDKAENLIEEFMVLTNEVVDRHLTLNGYPCIHRIHEGPLLNKLEDFFKFLNFVNLNYDKHSPMECCNFRKYFQDLQKFISKNDLDNSFYSSNLIRTLSKAKYSIENAGHYALSKEYYCHFTSPIRRYPDLVVHRLLDLCMKNEVDNDLFSKLSDIAYNSSLKEVDAKNAQRSDFYLKSFDYLERHIGDNFNGMITDIDRYGFNVILDNMINGRVYVNDVSNSCVLSNDNLTLFDVINGETYCVGDYLSLRVKDINRSKKRINFDINNKMYDKNKSKVLK